MLFNNYSDELPSIIPLVLIANSPQVIVSFLYIICKCKQTAKITKKTYPRPETKSKLTSFSKLDNGLFTCMLTEREWSQYSRKRAPLRVTIPYPGQRSTYFLQLPYLWSTPLLLGSALLHWFISQAIFLIRIAKYDHGVKLVVPMYVYLCLFDVSLLTSTFIALRPGTRAALSTALTAN